MNPTMTQVAELQKVQIDSLHDLAQTLVNAAEQLTNLHMAAARALLQETSQATQDVTHSADPQDALAVVSELAQPAAAKLASYSRNLFAVIFAAQAEVTRIVEARLAENTGKVVGLLDVALQDAPGGSEATVTMLKQAISASNASYDAIAKAAKHALAMAESNLAAAASAADQAAAAAVQAVTPKARKAA